MGRTQYKILVVAMSLFATLTLSASDFEWDQRSWVDDQLSSFAEWDGEFEKHCSNSKCSAITPSGKNLSDLQSTLNHSAEWDWVTKRVEQLLIGLIENKENFHIFSYDLENPTDAPRQDHKERVSWNYENYLLLLSYTDEIDRAKKRINQLCGYSKGAYHFEDQSCKKLKKDIRIMNLGIEEIYNETPLLAMGPMQNKLLLDVKESQKSKNNSFQVSEYGFKEKLAQAARKADKVALKKIKGYKNLLKMEDVESQKKALHSPNLLVELGPMEEIVGARKQSTADSTVLCRLSSRIYKEKAAGVLKDFAKSVGLVVLPGSSIKLVRIFSGAKRSSNRLAFSAAAGAEGVAVADAWQDVEEADRKCESLRNDFFSTSNRDIKKGEASRGSGIDWNEVVECERSLTSKKQMFVLGAIGGGVGASAAKNLPKPKGPDNISRIARFKKSVDRVKEGIKELKLTAQFRLKSRSFKKEHSTYDGIGQKDNRHFMDEMADVGTMEKKVVMEFELSFLKPLNEVTLKDKTFATALGNFGKKKFMKNLKSELGDKFEDLMKYSDYKSVRVALDDSPEARKAFEKAYKKTVDEVEAKFQADFPEAIELLKKRGSRSSGDIRKQFNGGMGSGIKGADKAMKMSRYARSMGTDEAGKLHHYDSFIKVFDKQAAQIEETRKAAQEVLLQAKGGKDALRKIDDNTYVLNSDAVQIIRKSSLTKRKRSSSEVSGKSDLTYFNNIRIAFRQKLGVKLTNEQVKVLVNNHHAIDEFSPGFFSVKRTDMSVDAMSPGVEKKSFITFDREKAGATNEVEIASAMARVKGVNAETALIEARRGVEVADEILKKWRASVQDSAFHGLSRDGKIRLLGGLSKFKELGVDQQARYLAGEHIDQFMRISADDAFLVGSGELSKVDFQDIGEAIAKSDVGGVTRTTVGAVRPSLVQPIITRLSHSRLGKTPGQIAQAAGEYREAISKKIVESIHRISNPGQGKKPYFEVHANYERPWDRIEVVVYDELSRVERRSFMRAVRRSVSTGRLGAIRFLPD